MPERFFVVDRANPFTSNGYTPEVVAYKNRCSQLVLDASKVELNLVEMREFRDWLDEILQEWEPE